MQYDVRPPMVYHASHLSEDIVERCEGHIIIIRKKKDIFSQLFHQHVVESGFLPVTT